jgi:hypothetical protein
VDTTFVRSADTNSGVAAGAEAVETTEASVDLKQRFSLVTGTGDDDAGDDDADSLQKRKTEESRRVPDVTVPQRQLVVRPPR